MRNELDQVLAAAFAQDLPPARDAAFCARVAEARARRAFRRDVGVMAFLTLAGGALLIPFAPLIAPAFKALTPALGPAAAGLAVAALVALLTGEGAEPRRT